MSPAHSSGRQTAQMGGVRIGIFGGSFDPVHRGHLALALHALSELNLDKVYFVPTHITPLKEKQDFLPAGLRLAMLKKAVSRNPRFAVSDIELKRKGLSYTVDTLRAFKKKFGRRAQLYFLSGADSPKEFARWKSPAEILKLSRFVVATRPGSALKTRDRRFLWMPMPPQDVSSSKVRRTLAEGKDISKLMAPGTAPMLKKFEGGKRKSNRTRR